MTVAACAGLVQRGDPDRFLAIMSAPVAARERLFPLVAYNIEVARAPWVTQEPAIAEMRLQWWRDAVEEIGAGKIPRAHEVAAPLAQVIHEADLPVDLLDAIAAARRWDIYDAAFEDAAHLDEYLDATGGGLTWAAARTLGAEAGQEAPVRAAGQAAAIANLLMAVPELEGRGRKPLVDGRAEGVRALARDGLSRLREARRHLPARGPISPALRLGWRAEAILTRAARQPSSVAEGRLGGAEAARRLSLMVRAMRGGW